MNNFCVQSVFHSKMRMQQRKVGTDSRWVDIIPWIQHWLLHRKGCSHLTPRTKMFPFSSNQFWQVSVNLFSSTEIWRREFLNNWQPIFSIWKELSSGCICCVWMCDLYLKYESNHTGLGKMEGLFKAFCGDFLFNKKLIYHSAFLPAACSKWSIGKDC